MGCCKKNGENSKQVVKKSNFRIVSYMMQGITVSYMMQGITFEWAIIIVFKKMRTK